MDAILRILMVILGAWYLMLHSIPPAQWLPDSSGTTLALGVVQRMAGTNASLKYK